eukprot:30657-Pelagococcus_subviridis.AAC.4
MALSSVEAEYMALSDATREVIYVNNLLKNVVALKKPTAIYIDNKGAGYIAEKELNNKLTKHVDVRYHFVRQYISEKKVELFYVPSAQNVADLFTKALCADLHRKRVGVEAPARARWCRSTSASAGRPTAVSHALARCDWRAEIHIRGCHVARDAARHHSLTCL